MPDVYRNHFVSVEGQTHSSFINGGFGMLIDGSENSSKHIKQMLHWDVNNGIARRSWARNENANFAIERAMEKEPLLKVTMPQKVEDDLLSKLDFS